MLRKSFLLISFIILLNANEYQDWLKTQDSSFNSYKESLEKEFEAYKKAYKESYKAYKKEILQTWPTAEVTTAHKWVEYSKNYETKKKCRF